MDYIHLPKDPLHMHSTVALYSRKAVDFASQNGTCWATYPEANGWDYDKEVTNLRSHIAEDETLLNLMAFLQEWLYFGLLGKLLGSAYRRSDFIDR